MRNQMGGHFTLSHEDVAYPLLHAQGLALLYPHVPDPPRVRRWREANTKHNRSSRLDLAHKYTEYHMALTAWEAWGQEAKQSAPAAHLSRFGTPIPKSYVHAAAGSNWMLWTARDLVPFPQPDLVQDLLGVDNVLKVQSDDARACISICRPKGQFVDRRDCGRAGTRGTFIHQSGALPLQPLMPVQDDAPPECCQLLLPRRASEKRCSNCDHVSQKPWHMCCLGFSRTTSGFEVIRHQCKKCTVAYKKW